MDWVYLIGGLASAAYLQRFRVRNAGIAYCKFCRRKLRYPYGTGRQGPASVCSHCGRTQPWASMSS